MYPVAILTGGLATRLLPITETIPKALVEVAGKPFIFHQLDWLQTQKIEKVVLCVGHLGEKIQVRVGNGDAWGIDISYSFDGEKLLGTGGALKKATPFLGREFFVFYGDSFLPIQFKPVADTFQRSGMPALMTVLRNEGRWDKSNVVFCNGKLLEYNKYKTNLKMTHIDYGLAIIKAEVFSSNPTGSCFDLADIYESLAKKSQMVGYEVMHRFYEIGSKEGLASTENYLKNNPS